jgi:hypothetical protein
MNKKYNKESGNKECGAARRICNRGNRCNRSFARFLYSNRIAFSSGKL